LLKPGKLTADEFDIMKSHAVIGASMLAGGHTPLVQTAELIALTHHERWDGSGYPHGLSGEAIPLVGRILAIADVFDALTNTRPYKEAWPVERAVNEISAGAGSHFDPMLVQVFLRIVKM
jgi:putative two-component system response regulator